MKEEKDFSQLCASPVGDLKELLYAEKEILLRIRFSKKMGDSQGFEARASRKRVARLKTALSLKKIKRGG